MIRIHSAHSRPVDSSMSFSGVSSLFPVPFFLYLFSVPSLNRSVVLSSEVCAFFGRCDAQASVQILKESYQSNTGSVRVKML